MRQFTGKERDAETGLDYFGARYMSGAQGRFMSADALMASADQTLPQSWNRYIYVLNNPLRFVDPTGELWVSSGDANNPYSWVDQCGDGQTCYSTIAASIGTSLRIYGSNNAQDVTNIAANMDGYVSLYDFNAHHNSAFDLKADDMTYAYVTAAIGAMFFNFGRDYKKQYSTAPDLIVTEAGSETGADVPGHQSHRNGKQLDLRFVDANGNSIASPKAADQSDFDRMQAVFNFANGAGLLRTTRMEA